MSRSRAIQSPPEDADLSRYAPPLRRFFQRRVAQSEVEDLIQEVFLALCSRRAATPIDNVDAYLFTIARHVLAKHAQRAANRPIELEPNLSDIGDDTPTIDRSLIGRQRLHRVLAAIQQMPPRTQAVFVMHRFQDKSYSSIAQELDISVSAVEKHIMAALRTLTALEADHV